MSESVRQIRDLGTKLLQQVYRVSRLAAYHDTENEAFAKASSQLCETIRAVNQIEDQSARILFFHQSILIGTQYLKAPQSVYAMGTEVRESLEKLGVNEIVFEDSTGPEDIADFAALVANPSGSGKSPDELDIGTSIRFRRVDLDIAGSRRKRTKQERLAYQYASAIVVVRRLYENLKDGKYVMIQQLKRISQGLIELADDENRLALGVGSMRNLSFDDAGCAVNAAILSIAAARTVTDDRETLSLAAMGAMLADCGRPRVAGMTESELGKIRAIPRLSNEERLRMAASSAVVLTALGRLHEKSLPRLVLSFESLVAQYSPEVNSAFPDGSDLGDLSLLVSVVWRYINSLRFDVRKQSQRAPELALGALVRHVRSPREALILKLLTRVLGYLPVGTPVETTEGWLGIVSGGGKVELGKPLAPSILLVLDPSTHPTDVRIVDLSDPANRETYGLIKGVVPAEAHVLLSRKQWEILDGLGKPREAMSAPPVIESISDPDAAVPDETIDIPIEIVDTQPRQAFETPAAGPPAVSKLQLGGSAAEENASAEQSTTGGPTQHPSWDDEKPTGEHRAANRIAAALALRDEETEEGPTGEHRPVNTEKTHDEEEDGEERPTDEHRPVEQKRKLAEEDEEPVTKAVGKAKVRSLLDQFLPEESSTSLPVVTPEPIPEVATVAETARADEELNTRTVTKGEADKLLSAFMPDALNETKPPNQPAAPIVDATEFDPTEEENTRTVGRQEADKLLDKFMPAAPVEKPADREIRADEVTLTVDQSTANTLLEAFVSPNSSDIVGNNPFSKGIHEQVTKSQEAPGPPPPPKEPPPRSKEPPPPPQHPANSFAGGRQDGDLTPTGLAFDLTLPPLPNLETPTLAGSSSGPAPHPTPTSVEAVVEEVFELSTEVMAKGTADRLVAPFELEPPSTEQLGEAATNALTAGPLATGTGLETAPVVGEALKVPVMDAAAEEVWAFDSSLSTDARQKSSADKLTEKFVEPSDEAPSPTTHPPKFAVLKKRHRKKRSR